MRPQIRISPLSCAALLAVCQFIVLVPLLSVYPIGGSSEAREAQIADLIVRSGEWLIPLRNGLAPSKPPLFHWIAALFGSVSGGVTPFIARAVSLLFASGVVFLSSLLTLRACEAGSESLRRNKHTLAIFSAIVLTTTFGYVNMAGDARVDMTYCFFFCLALYPFFSACSTDSISGLSLLEIRKPWRWNVFFVGMGLGVLAKGPIAVVLPSVIVFCVLWSCFSWREALRAMSKPRLGWVYFAVLAAPWYVLLFFRGGDSILQRQLFFENIQRFMGGAEVNSQPFWYYVPEFLRTALPWSVLFVAMLPEFFSYMRRPYVQAEPYAGLRAIRQSYALWFWVGFLFLSIASGKRQSYLLPLFPAMAVFLSLRGFKFYSEMSDRSRARLLTVSRAALQVLFALLLIVAACFDFLRFAPPLQFGLKSEVLLFLGQFALRIEVL
ncbi:MAG: glycosyltransferase family 39 protein, partial [Deltaproteobacteria bacterium]|nr:glycosyltransferase family 39 protein [Deltaproteobacteria bacterium]